MPQPTVNLSEFLPLVRPYAPGAPVPVMTQALRLAAIRFCADTKCWREKTTITVTRQHYPMVAPSYAEIHKIERATFNGVRLVPVPYEQIDDYDFTALGQPSCITQSAPNEVAIVPYEDGELSLSLFLKPRQGVFYAGATGAGGTAENWFDTVPAFLLSQHGEAIAAGALTRLLVMPDQPFMNPDLAAISAATFQTAIDRHSTAFYTGQQRARPRTRASYF